MKNALHLINRFTRLCGHAIRWLALFMVLISCAVVILRYSFDMPSIALQEAVMYLHASLFMLGSAYTWQQGGHVRVDVFYRNWSPARQALVDRLGILLLLVPFCLFMLWISWEYVATAWAIGEKSPESGGLPLVFLLKTLILALPALMLVQAVAELGNTFTHHKDPEDLHADQETHYG
ncbi:TRAP transporter small permease subunit [Thalassolituus sp. LLYu03]|uniref:TRAP transporter small permease subunit n=1 Tax=Thalassolituus sp. LLYu03 TaxID=3421656 RepID=UPI003D2A30CA